MVPAASAVGSRTLIDISETASTFSLPEVWGEQPDYGGMIVRPTKEVMSNHRDTNTKPGCQKNRIQPLRVNSFITA